MELTKEQQKIINRYKRLPGFLQERYTDKVHRQLRRLGMDPEYGRHELFNSSSKGVKLKMICDHSFESILRTEECQTFVRSLSLDEQRSLIEKMKTLSPSEQKLYGEQEDILISLNYIKTRELSNILGAVRPELQEENFVRCLNAGDLNFIKGLSNKVIKAHEEEICTRDSNCQVSGFLWETLSVESKSKYMERYISSGLDWLVFKHWNELDEKGQSYNMKKLFDSYDMYKRNFLEIWRKTNSQVQQQYFDTYVNHINGGENREEILLEVWNVASDAAQNSSIGKEIINNATPEYLKKLYAGANSEVQRQILVKKIREKAEKIENEEEKRKNIPSIARAQSMSSYYRDELRNLFSEAKPNLYKNYLSWLLEEPNLDIYDIVYVLDFCPENIKKEYSANIGKYLTTKLDVIIQEGLQSIIAKSAMYLDNDSIGVVIENIFDKGVETSAYIDKYNTRKVEAIEKLFGNIELERQKEIYFNYIKNNKLEYKLNMLYNLMNFENVEQAKELLGKYFDKYSPEKKDKVIERFEEIYKFNNTIAKSIDSQFIASDIVDSFTKEQLLRITLYPEVQQQLLKHKDNTAFIETVKKMLDTNENWTLAADSMLKNIESKQYDELLQDIKENPIDGKYYENLSIALTKANYFGLTKKEDIEKYFDKDGKRMQMLLDIMKGESIDLPDSLKGLTKQELKKFAVSEYLYGMDLTELEKYQIRFGGVKGLEGENTEYIKQLVNGIETLNNITPEQLTTIIQEITEGKRVPTDYAKDIHLDSKAINLFREAYEKGVYNPAKKEQDKIEPIEYNGKKIDVYRVQDDFKMLARVEGAYTSLSGISSYTEYYDSPNISTHGNCESVIGQDQIGLARNRNGNIIVGYASLPPNSMLVSAPYDLGTTNKSLAPFHDKLSLDFKFYNLQETIDNTRHTHNETVMDRLVVDKDGNVQKLRPSYLIWVEDRKTDKFPPEFGEEPQDKKEKQKYQTQKHLWEETQRAAEELGIPIVIINREICAEKEMAKLQEMKDMLTGKKELPKDKTLADIAREAIVKFENNVEGLQFAEEDVREKYFNHEQREQLLATVMGVLDQMPDMAYEQRHEYLSKITETIMEENNKYSAEGIKSYKEIEKYYNTKAKEIKNKLVEYREYIGKAEGVDCTISLETKKMFETAIRSIASTDYYANNKAHSIEHIEKVMLFSALLAKNEGLDEKDTKLLLAAAAFHDSFRQGADGKEEHAKGSAEEAKKYFDENKENAYGIQESDVPLMQVAIEYHEYQEQVKGNIDRNKIYELCEKYGYKDDFERVVRISGILKDADALDRTRFATRGRLDTQYLRADSAKSRKMVTYAEKVNGYYAKKMLDRNYGTNGEISEFEAVEELQKRRIAKPKEGKVQEETLTVDEMLELFYEVEKEQTREPNEQEKKETVAKAFAECEVGKEDIELAVEMIGIGEETIEQAKSNMEVEDI